MTLTAIRRKFLAEMGEYLLKKDETTFLLWISVLENHYPYTSQGNVKLNTLYQFISIRENAWAEACVAFGNLTKNDYIKEDI